MPQSAARASKRGPRSDATRNRARLLAAASKLFIERGPDVPFTEIAKAAQVGVGTIYRHFPTREELIEAAYHSELVAVCEAAGELLAAKPPEEALRAWMDRFGQYMTTKLGLADAIRAVVVSGGNPFAQSREKLTAALGSLLDATSAAGVTRREVSADDLLMTLSGIAMAAGAPDQHEQLQRMIDLVFEGVRSR
ncbi:helix-turn-helix domain-containing protein [Amycolatopsis rhabdoformis]|uniref:Helix-turn-helix domain-containing protein n=1 Tax=Amycolatopsis rhabdoformis TaxID=1448059 RepID=A0ABZ1ICZ5_9PSEU|nr:helix-turn-helix domain-containing protein [Amycolatopsis rhabdoformis]WSE32122.1 helix-turn-helix domain-containing protein [Amycolatopsis rhabdoformis]